MSENNEKLLSDTISWLRFPLIVLVVLIHVPMGNWEGAPIASLICEWGIQKGIATVAVPLFFLISGFLYFYKVKTWTIEVYEKKSLARVKTLLVPFLVWSIPATIYSWVVCHAGLSAGTFWELHKTPTEIFWGVLGFFRPDLEGEGLKTPLVAQFWFVRDLFVVCMCAPFWRFLLSKIPKISISFLCAYWFFHQGAEIPGLNTQAVFFFCLGAFFSIRGRNLVSDVSHFGGGLWVPAALLFWALGLLAHQQGWDWTFYLALRRLWIVCGIGAIIFLASKGIETGRLTPSPFLAGASFFVFALHYAAWFITPQERLLSMVYAPNSNLSAIIVFFLKPLWQIGLCLLGYWLLSKKLPRVLPYLTGGR